MTVSYIALSGGPLADYIVRVEDAVADLDGVPGTIINEEYSTATINAKGEAEVVKTPCIYRVCNLSVRFVNGQEHRSGKATYVGVSN